MKMDVFLKPGSIFALLIFALTGCSSNGIQDQAIGGNAFFDFLEGKDRMAALATTADYRTVVVNTNKNLACPEPSPDVGQAVSKIASLGARLESEGDLPAGSIDALSASLKDITPLLQRTRGLQLYRDARSYNCFSHMNGALQGQDLVLAEKQALETAKVLLLAEILAGDDPSAEPDKLEAPSLERILKLVEGLERIVSSEAEKAPEEVDQSEENSE